MFVPYKSENLVTIVPVQEAHAMTSKGWTVVGFLDEVDATKIPCGSQIPMNGQYGAQMGYATNDMPMMVRKAMVVLELNPANQLTAVTDMYEKTKKALDDVQPSLKEKDKKIGELSGYVNDFKGQKDHWEKVSGENLKLAKDKQTIIEKMEKDLGKVREHVGAKAWKEIFPPKDPT